MFNELNEILNKLLYKFAENPCNISLYAVSFLASATALVAEMEDVDIDKNWSTRVPNTVDKTFDASQIINIFKEDIKHENQETED